MFYSRQNHINHKETKNNKYRNDIWTGNCTLKKLGDSNPTHADNVLWNIDSVSHKYNAGQNIHYQWLCIKVSYSVRKRTSISFHLPQYSA